MQLNLPCRTDSEAIVLIVSVSVTFSFTDVTDSSVIPSVFLTFPDILVDKRPSVVVSTPVKIRRGPKTKTMPSPSISFISGVCNPRIG